MSNGDQWLVTIHDDGTRVYDLMPLSDPQWHVLRRADGSVSVYWTTQSFHGHMVAWDSLDGVPMPDALRRMPQVHRLACLLLGWEAQP